MLHRNRMLGYAIALQSLPLFLIAQKPSLHPFKNDAWIRTAVGGAKFSDNGAYFVYGINYFENADRSVAFLRSAAGDWKMQLEDVSLNQVHFDSRSQFVIYKKGADSLYVLRLGTTSATVTPLVSSFFVPDKGSGRMAYYIGNRRRLMIREFKTGTEKMYDNIKEYRFSEDGNSIALTTVEQDSLLSIYLVDLNNNKKRRVWLGKNYHQLVMDSTAAHLAFLTGGNTLDRYSGSLWYYEKGMQAAKCVFASGDQKHVGDYFVVDEQIHFGKDKQEILFKLDQHVASLQKNQTMVALDVWHYNDSVLWSDRRVPETKGMAVLHAHSGKLVLLTGGYKKIKLPQLARYGMMLISERLGMEEERFWNPVARETVRLVSTKDGRIIKDFGKEGVCNAFNVSPSGAFMVYYNNSINAYFSYEFRTGNTRNISRLIPVSLSAEETPVPGEPRLPLGIGAWEQSNNAVYIYDHYDIWRLDVRGQDDPVNITKSYGRQHGIRFRFQKPLIWQNSFAGNESIILNTFSYQTKDRGFYRLRLGSVGAPELLSAGGYSESGLPQIAANGSGAIYIRTTASMAPNYFYTSDHKHFEQLTNIVPHAAYNWMNAQLINWTMNNGKPAQGILYTPENFDSTKRYPVIFYYYEHSSDQLHDYVKPGPSVMLDYPYFVSNGYLIFVPDIKKKLGAPGPSAFIAVASAADYLSKFRWVDSTRMGLGGHSYGSYETNYIITATARFKAAYSGCGSANLISLYGQSSTGLMWCETGQISMGSALSDNPEAYMENSPVFKTANIHTPLLLLYNKNDHTNFQHGVEMFTALRRQRKPVWLLQYDEGDHTMSGKEVEDFSLRLSQFFDHYLKDKPAPIWMTRGIPFGHKQVFDGLAIDSGVIESYKSKTD